MMGISSAVHMYVAVPNIFGVSKDAVAEEYPQGGNVDSYCVSRCSKEKI